MPRPTAAQLRAYKILDRFDLPELVQDFEIERVQGKSGLIITCRTAQHVDNIVKNHVYALFPKIGGWVAQLFGTKNYSESISI